jgi:probable addiction module antidote protein
MAEQIDDRDSPPDKAEIKDYLNAAFSSGDVARIARAIGTAAKVHNISEVAKKAKLARPSVYRAFAGERAYPNLTTVVRVLEAMGFGLRVKQIKKHGAKSFRLRRGQLDG